MCRTYFRQIVTLSLWQHSYLLDIVFGYDTDTVRLVRKFIFLASPLIAAICSRTELCICMNTSTDKCVHACICSMCLHVHTQFMPVTVSLISDWFSDESMLNIAGPRKPYYPPPQRWTYWCPFTSRRALKVLPLNHITTNMVMSSVL